MKNNFLSPEAGKRLREIGPKTHQKQDSKSKTRDAFGFRWPAGFLADSIGCKLFDAAVVAGCPHWLNNVALGLGWGLGFALERKLEHRTAEKKEKTISRLLSETSDPNPLLPNI